MVKRALLIGINYIGQPGELSGCHQDVKDMRKFLKLHKYTEFTILLEATKNDILSAIAYIVSVTKAGDYLFVHYSGHGTQAEDVSGDELDKKDECICPVDYKTTGVISDDDLRVALVLRLASDTHLRACFDSCHSGSVLDIRNGRDVPIDIIMISGCRPEQVSMDMDTNGAMTWALLSCMRERSFVDIFDGKPYTWKKLVKSMVAKLSSAGYAQMPTLDYTLSNGHKNVVDI